MVKPGQAWRSRSQTVAAKTWAGAVAMPNLLGLNEPGVDRVPYALIPGILAERQG
jgi:hypothetical protein